MTMRISAVAAAVAAVLVTSCSSAGYTGSRLHPLVAEDASFSIAMPSVPQGSSIVIDMMHLCTTKGTPITIDRLTPIDPTGGVRITSWGIDPPGTFADTEDGVLGHVHAGFGHVPVRGRCGLNLPGSLFAVSLAASSPFGSMRGVRLDYNHGQHVNANIGLSVCSTKQCRSVDSA